MTAQREIIQGAIVIYQEEIVPTLTAGDYELAAIQMGSLYTPFELMGRNERLNLMTSVKQGLNFVSSMGRLTSLLSESPPNPRNIGVARNQFETFAAQTSLPLD